MPGVLRCRGASAESAMRVPGGAIAVHKCGDRIVNPRHWRSWSCTRRAGRASGAHHAPRRTQAPSAPQHPSHQHPHRHSRHPRHLWHAAAIAPPNSTACARWPSLAVAWSHWERPYQFGHPVRRRRAPVLRPQRIPDHRRILLQVRERADRRASAQGVLHPARAADFSRLLPHAAPRLVGGRPAGPRDVLVARPVRVERSGRRHAASGRARSATSGRWPSRSSSISPGRG